MVELRKRKASGEIAPPIKKANSVKSAPRGKKDERSPNGPALSQKVALGDTIELDGFGGEIITQEGVKTTLKKLVDDSENGVVLFTYPKASTPGCTTQACLFKDEFTRLTKTGLSIYGLSTDSPKSNSNFKSKQKLPYLLLCDPAATLIKAIGMKKAPSGTTRGVFVINKEGKVQAVSPGGPAATVDIVRKLVVDGSGTSGAPENHQTALGIEHESATGNDAMQLTGTDGDEAKAEVAAEVADTASKLDDGAAV